jgi:hypothetical protein
VSDPDSELRIEEQLAGRGAPPAPRPDDRILGDLIDRLADRLVVEVESAELPLLSGESLRIVVLSTRSSSGSGGARSAPGRRDPVTEFHPAGCTSLDSTVTSESSRASCSIPPDPHALTRTEYPWGIALVCACGQWECVVTGPSSADWARRDHQRHRTLTG